MLTPNQLQRSQSRPQTHRVRLSTSCRATLTMRPLPTVEMPENGGCLTVGEAADSWLKGCAETRKPSTCAAYRTVVESHIKPELGDFPVSRLTPQQISSFLRGKNRGSDGHPPLASSTVCSIVTVLRAVLRHAEERGAAFSGWAAVNRPRRHRHQTDTLTKEDQAQLEKYLWDDPDPRSLGILICLYTGIRIGEVCALKWEDISVLGVLSVRKTVQRIRNPRAHIEGESRTVLLFDTPKSESSLRLIPLPSVLWVRLNAHRRAPECFVLTGTDAAVCEPRTLQYYFKCVLRRCGVDEINFHALRHTFATNCVEKGFDPKTLSRILGHSDVGITLNTYVHPSMSLMRSMMERLNPQDS